MYIGFLSKKMCFSEPAHLLVAGNHLPTIKDTLSAVELVSLSSSSEDSNGGLTDGEILGLGDAPRGQRSRDARDGGGFRRQQDVGMRRNGERKCVSLVTPKKLKSLILNYD